jgi:hypothetical protein
LRKLTAAQVATIEDFTLFTLASMDAKAFGAAGFDSETYALVLAEAVARKATAEADDPLAALLALAATAAPKTAATAPTRKAKSAAVKASGTACPAVYHDPSNRFKGNAPAKGKRPGCYVCNDTGKVDGAQTVAVSYRTLRYVYAGQRFAKDVDWGAMIRPWLTKQTKAGHSFTFDTFTADQGWLLSAIAGS